MAVSNPFSRFPQKMRVETQNEIREYDREADSFAIHGPVPPALIPLVVYSFAAPEIHVCRGNVSYAAFVSPEQIITPVYRLGMQGPQGVPTGKVLIRFMSQVSVETRRSDIQACGFFISESLAYAPFAAWLEHEDKHIATALNEFAKLRAISDVELVEPQMLMRAVRR
jgi:hypothetical protein